jgi:hypothetical protein
MFSKRIKIKRVERKIKNGAEQTKTGKKNPANEIKTKRKRKRAGSAEHPGFRNYAIGILAAVLSKWYGCFIFNLLQTQGSRNERNSCSSLSFKSPGCAHVRFKSSPSHQRNEPPQTF